MDGDVEVEVVVIREEVQKIQLGTVTECIGNSAEKRGRYLLFGCRKEFGGIMLERLLSSVWLNCAIINTCGLTHFSNRNFSCKRREQNLVFGANYL